MLILMLFIMDQKNCDKKPTSYVHSLAIILAEALNEGKNAVINQQYFDTLKVKPKMSIEELKKRAESKHVNLRYFPDNQHVII